MYFARKIYMLELRAPSGSQWVSHKYTFQNPIAKKSNFIKANYNSKEDFFLRRTNNWFTRDYNYVCIVTLLVGLRSKKYLRATYVSWLLSFRCGRAFGSQRATREWSIFRFLRLTIHFVQRVPVMNLSPVRSIMILKPSIYLRIKQICLIPDF